MFLMFACGVGWLQIVIIMSNPVKTTYVMPLLVPKMRSFSYFESYLCQLAICHLFSHYLCDNMFIISLSVSII